MRGRIEVLRGEGGNVLVFVIVVLMVAAVSLPAFLNFSFESLRSARRGQDEMQRFYAADIGVEDALFRLGDTSVAVPFNYELEDVNGYDVDVSIFKAAGQGVYRITSIAATANGPETIVETSVSMYELTVQSGSGGNVTVPAEGVYVYPADADVTLVATPDSGYDFDNWTGDVADSDAAGTIITMDADHTVTANFVVPPSGDYRLTTGSTAGGSVVTPGEGTYWYSQDWVVDLAASAESGYSFDGWMGDIVDVADPAASVTTITMSGNYTITAGFVEAFTLTISSSDSGSVSTPGEGDFTYGSGAVVGLEAVTDVGCDFTNWTGDVGAIDDVNAASTTITMLGDYAIQANFETASCNSCFEYAMASLSEDDPLQIDNNGVIDGNIYGNAGVELVNGAIIDGECYSNGDLKIDNVAEIRGNAHVLGDLTIENNGEVHGNAYVDGDVLLKNNAEVYGDVWATGQVRVQNAAQVYGTIHEYSDPGDLPTMPTLDPPTAQEIEDARSEYESQARAGGTLNDDKVIEGVEDIGPLYIDGDLTIKNGASVTLLGTIYVTGKIDMNNNVAVTGTAAAIVAEGDIVIDNNSDIDLSGVLVIMSVYKDIEAKNNSDIRAALYAPNGGVKLDNPNSMVFGALLGVTVTAKNNINVEYDTGLSDNDDLPACGCP